MSYDDIELEYDEIDIDESDDWTTEQFYQEDVVDACIFGVAVGAAIGTCLVIISNIITDDKYGRFPMDMKKVLELINSPSFDPAADKRELKKALKNVSKDLRFMLYGYGGRWKVTVKETKELETLYRIVADLYDRGFMISSNPNKNKKRRVDDRIKEFVDQSKVVLTMMAKDSNVPEGKTKEQAMMEWYI